MPESAEQLVHAVLRSSAFVAVAAVVLLVVLRRLNVHSARVHRICWFAVLLQGLLLVTLRVEVPVADVPQPDAPRADVSTAELALFEFDDTLLAHTGNGFIKSAGDVEDAHGVMLVNAKEREAEYSGPALLLVAWLAGIVLTLAWQAFEYCRFVNALPTDLQPQHDWKSQWDAVRNEAAVSEDIEMTMTHDVGPALYRTVSGFRLLLPLEHWTTLTVNQRELVLRHELAHYQRGDLWKGLFFQLLATVHWFNPFAWLAVRRLAECAEWSCDAAVHRSATDSCAEYVRALLQISTPPQRLPNVVPTAAGHSVVRRAQRLLTPDFKEESRMKKLMVITILATLAVTNGLTFELVAQDDATAATPVPVTENAAHDDAPANSKPNESAEETKTAAPADTGEDSDAVKQVPTTATHGLISIAPDHVFLVSDDVNSGLRLNLNGIRLENSAGGSLHLTSSLMPATREAVIDVGYVFKHLPEFQRFQKSMKKELVTQDHRMRDERKALQDLAKKLKDESLSAVREKIEIEIEERNAKMKAETADFQRRLLDEESKMSLTVFNKVRGAIAEHAKEHGIQIVRRATTRREQQKKLDSGDPTAILEAMNEQVLYVADDNIDSIDITEAVLKRLRGKTTDSESRR